MVRQRRPRARRNVWHTFGPDSKQKQPPSGKQDPNVYPLMASMRQTECVAFVQSRFHKTTISNWKRSSKWVSPNGVHGPERMSGIRSVPNSKKQVNELAQVWSALPFPFHGQGVPPLSSEEAAPPRLLLMESSSQVKTGLANSSCTFCKFRLLFFVVWGAPRAPISMLGNYCFTCELDSIARDLVLVRWTHLCSTLKLGV